MKTKVILTALMLTATIGLATAQNTNSNNTQNAAKATKSCFVDANNDGICDSHANGTCTLGNGKGLMDGSGTRQGVRDGSGRGRRGEQLGLHDGTGRRVNYKNANEGKRGGGYGPGDGTGNRNKRVEETSKRPMDGTGNGTKK